MNTDSPTPVAEIEQRTLPHAFDRHLRIRPDAPLLDGDHGAYTYAEAHHAALCIAGGLGNLGVQAGDRVAVMLDNSTDTALAWFATALTKVVEVPVNTAYRGNFLATVINDSGATVVMIEDDYCERLAQIANDLPYLEFVVVRGGDGAAAAAAGWRVIRFESLLQEEPTQVVKTLPSDLLSINYTSGTTGRSKGVLVPHAQAYTYSHWMESLIGPESTSLVTLPLFHIAGQWAGLYQALITGAGCVIRPRFSPSTFWDDVRRFDANYTVLVGAAAQILLAASPKPDDPDNPLEIATVVPLPADIDVFEKRFGLRLATASGMTEAGSFLAAFPGNVKPGGAGRPRPGVQCRIVDENDMDVPIGTMGELIVRPDLPWTTMLGYHNLPEQTAAAFRNLWLHTGDAFVQDEDGEFYFRDRMKDAMRRRGENISSAEVEAVVNTHPAVLESAAVAVPSELGEDDIKIVIVTREGESLNEVEFIEFLAQQMPHYMVPRYVEVVDALPKTPTLKVRKAALRADGVTEQTWDREKHQITVGREGLRKGDPLTVKSGDAR